MRRVNTGNYRIGLQKVGIGGTRKIDSKFSDRAKALQALRGMEKKVGWDYYIEEEVIYKDTMFDQEGKPIDMKPSWERMQI